MNNFNYENGAEKIIHFFKNIKNEKDSNEQLNMFCYQCFPSFFFNFTIRDSIPKAYLLIQEISKIINFSDLFQKKLIGKMISVFFVGFPYILLSFTNQLYVHFQVPKMKNKLSSFFKYLPDIFTQYHIEIIKLIANDHKDIFIQYVIKDVLFKSAFHIIQYFIFYGSFPYNTNSDQIKSEIEKSINDESQLNHAIGIFLSRINSMELNGTDISYIPKIINQPIDYINVYFSTRELGLLSRLFQISTRQNENNVLLQYMLDIIPDNDNDQNLNIIDNQISFFKMSEKDNTTIDKTQLETQIEELKKYENFAYDEQVLHDFSETIKRSTELYLIYIADKLLQNTVGTGMKRIEILKQKTYNPIYYFIVLLGIQETVSQPFNKLMESYMISFNLGNDLKPLISTKFCSFMEQVDFYFPYYGYFSYYANKEPKILILINFIIMTKYHLSMFNSQDEDLKPKIYHIFQYILLKEQENTSSKFDIFGTYAQLSKLLQCKTTKTELSTALLNIEPDYEEYITYLDDFFKNVIFPLYPKVESWFDFYMNM